MHKEIEKKLMILLIVTHPPTRNLLYLYIVFYRLVLSGHRITEQDEMGNVKFRRLLCVSEIANRNGTSLNLSF